MKPNKFIQIIEIDWNRIPEHSYLRNISVLRNLKHLEFNSNITFFAGENGSGKSTLLEAIAVAYGLTRRAEQRITRLKLTMMYQN